MSYSHYLLGHIDRKLYMQIHTKFNIAKIINNVTLQS